MAKLDNLFGLAQLPMMISIFSGVAALLLGRKYRGLLWYYVLASFSADIIGLFLLLQWIPLKRFWQSNLFLLCELLIVSQYLISRTMSGVIQKWTTAATYGLASFFVLDTLFKKPTICISFTTLNYSGAGVLYTFLVILLLWSFYKLLTDIAVPKIEHSPLFIFSSAMLLYVAPSLVIMLGWDYLKKNSPNLFDTLREVRHVLNILKNVAIAYIFYAYGRYVNGKRY